MRSRLFWVIAAGSAVLATALLSIPAPAEVVGTVKSVDTEKKSLVVVEQGTNREVPVLVSEKTAIRAGGDPKVDLGELRPGARVVIQDTLDAAAIELEGQLIGTVTSRNNRARKLAVVEDGSGKTYDFTISDRTILEKTKGPDGHSTDVETIHFPQIEVGSHVLVNQTSNGLSRILVEKVPTSFIQEFWHNFTHNLFKPLLLFFYMGFLVPILGVKFEFPYVIYQGLTIYLLIAIGWHGGEELAGLPSKELINAGGFMVVGFLTNFIIGVLAYLSLSLLTRMRRIDKATVAGYYGSDSAGTFVTCLGVLVTAHIFYEAYMPVMLAVMEVPGCLVALFLVSRLRHQGMDPLGTMPDEPGYNPNAAPLFSAQTAGGHDMAEAVEAEKEMSLEKMEHGNGTTENGRKAGSFLSPQLLHEVFLNPGLYLLFGGIIIGFISGKQGPAVTRDDDNFFVMLFQGMLCLFLLEMGMTASRKLRDLRTAGPGFILFGLVAPNIFATLGIFIAHSYSMATGIPFQLGTYALFSVLCAAASYIAVPAVQRLAIPEASPTLPLAASLGLTFSYNVTIGIPIYIEIAKAVMRAFPVH